ncbi:SET domain-containing protein [Hesseltinella vesiculosa]|uniref:SET domain-containing protein n=1 Tax=Hesseltinella vesiculosa TaxID=101127 RepID=A0A1X2G6M3_9FUNG|nr:SET domain-containing protein [Hesseltinella vesiculosa]
MAFGIDSNRSAKGTVVNDARHENFLKWLKKHDFPGTKLRLATFKDTGRGMMATDDIATGEVLVQVPKRLLISSNQLQTVYGDHSLSPHQLLAAHLILLRSEVNSWWKPYLDLLPNHFKTLPVNFSEEHSALLPPSLADEILQQKRKIQDDFDAVLAFFKGRQDISLIATVTLDMFKWAWLCVNTRSIHVRSTSRRVKDCDIALAPLLDFLNHSNEAQIESGLNLHTQCFEIKTLTPYKAGEQVFINYGPHDNQAIFREYGFVLPKNGYNFVSVDNEVWKLFEECESIQDARRKRQILCDSGYEGDYTVKMNDISYRLVCALRLLATGPNHRKQIDWQEMIMGHAEHIDDENERKVNEMLITVCSRALADSKQKHELLSTQGTSIHPLGHLFLNQIWAESIAILENAVEQSSKCL